jgi:hypothetical protein
MNHLEIETMIQQILNAMMRQMMMLMVHYLVRCQSFLRVHSIHCPNLGKIEMQMLIVNHIVSHKRTES